MSASAVYVLDLKGKVRPGGRCGRTALPRAGRLSPGPGAEGGRARPAPRGAPGRRVPRCGCGAAFPLPPRGGRVACVARSPLQPLRGAAAGGGGGSRARGHPLGVMTAAVIGGRLFQRSCMFSSVKNVIKTCSQRWAVTLENINA